MHYKYILCRRLVLRSFCPSDTGGSRCRCCGQARETHNHLLRCHVLWGIWKPLRRLTSELWKRVHIGVEFVYLGVNAEGDIMPAGLLALHRIMWKMIIIAITKVEFENGKVDPKHIWSMICRRFIVRVRALYSTHAWARHSAITFGRNPPKPHTINKWMNPIALCDENGSLTWHSTWRDLCGKYNIKLKPRETLHPCRSKKSDGRGMPQTKPKPTHGEIRRAYACSFVRPKRKRRIECDD